MHIIIPGVSNEFLISVKNILAPFYAPPKFKWDIYVFGTLTIKKVKK